MIANSLNTSTLYNDISSLKIVSLNCHGFQQSSNAIAAFCNKNDLDIDIIFLQELWLSPCNFYKIELFSENYICFGKSSMEKVVSNFVLRGRPFGGLCILIKSGLADKVTFSKITERFTIIVLDKYIFINVYFPSIVNDTDSCTVHSMLADIESVIELFPDLKVICGGDYNVHLDSLSGRSTIYSKFISDYNLVSTHAIIPSNLSYTYCHETLQHYSYIDYFLIDDVLKDDLEDFKILDLADNFSDHNGIYMKLSCKISVKSHLDNKNEVTCGAEAQVHKNLRWDHANLQHYYDFSRVLLQPIHDNLCISYNNYLSVVSQQHNNYNINVSDSFHYHKVYSDVVQHIESVYNQTVSALVHAAHCTIPVEKHNFRKFWWSQELDALKQHSIISHQNWIHANRPTQGPIYIEKCRAKAAYRNCIRNNQKVENDNVSNSLHDALVTKSQQMFWKTWNSKFGKKKILPRSFNGIVDDQEISNHFAEHFANSCSVNSKDKNVALAKSFFAQWSHYKGNDSSFEQIDIDVDMIDKVVTSLKLGKAAGLDSLTAEHIKHAHPIALSIISKMFNLMVHFDYVPDAFGIGMTIPLPKHDSMCK